MQYINILLVLWPVSPPLETRQRDVRTTLRCVRLHLLSASRCPHRQHSAHTMQMRAAAGFASVHLHVSRYKDRNGSIMRQLTLPNLGANGAAKRYYLQKERNYRSHLTKFLANDIRIYDSKLIYYENIFHN